MSTDLRAAVARVHALHVEYHLRFFDEDDHLGAEDVREDLDELILDLARRAHEWPEATDAILDLCFAHEADRRSANDPDDDDLAYRDESDAAYIDIGFELQLPGAAAHFEWFRRRAAASHRGIPPVPIDWAARLTKIERTFRECVESLGPEPWHAGSERQYAEEWMHQMAQHITTLLEWMEPNERRIRARRAARAVRRLPYAHLRDLGAEWGCVQRAVAAFAKG